MPPPGPVGEGVVAPGHPDEGRVTAPFGHLRDEVPRPHRVAHDVGLPVDDPYVDVRRGKQARRLTRRDPRGERHDPRDARVGSDLQRRYLATLATQEDRLFALEQKVTALQSERATAAKALDDYVNSVTL